MSTPDPLIGVIARALGHATGDTPETWADESRAVYEAIAASGRLLPEGGETRTEHGYRYRVAHKNWTHIVPMLDAEEAAESVLDVLAIGAVGAEALVRTVYIGPWEVAP